MYEDFGITIEEYLEFWDKNRLPDEFRCYDLSNVFIPGFRIEHLYKEELWVEAKHPELSISSYEVSSFGNMRSKDTKILRRNTIGVDGYIRQEFRDDIIKGFIKTPAKRKKVDPLLRGEKQPRTKRVRHRSRGNLLFRHVIVLNSFVKNPSKLPVVDHINRIRGDNRLCNLRFVSYSDNTKNQKKRSRKPVIERVDGLDLTVIDTWPSISEISNVFGHDTKELSKVCLTSSYLGCYIWRYKDRLNDDETLRTIRYENSDITVSSGGKVILSGGRVTLGTLRADGYLSITINNRHYMIHNLVCMAFHGPPKSLEMTADHINGSRSCNEASNLCWATPEQQTANRKYDGHSYATNCKKVKITNLITLNSIVYDSISKAREAFQQEFPHIPDHFTRALTGEQMFTLTNYRIEKLC